MISIVHMMPMYRSLHGRLAAQAGVGRRECRAVFLSGRLVCVGREAGLSGVGYRMCAGGAWRCLAAWVLVSAGGCGGRAGLLAGR